LTRQSALTNVFGFSRDRERVARFFVEVIGMRRQTGRDDSVWFEPEGGATLTIHDPEDEPLADGFVPWFHVDDVTKAFERARANDANVGEIRDGYFLARDPDGRLFGVRQWR
jgi:hypothetical protein